MRVNPLDLFYLKYILYVCTIMRSRFKVKDWRRVVNTARIFKNGNSQAVRLPKEFQFDSSEVEIFRRGEEIVLRKKPSDLTGVFELLSSLSDDFMENGRQQLPIQEREPI
jgi:antitoxin VapB